MKNNQLLENQEDSGRIELGYKSACQYTTASTASGTSSTSGFVEISPSTSPAPLPTSKKQLQLAIMAHIRAIRTLGRTKINTQDIADALSISVQEVNNTIEILNKQGVRRR